MTEFMHRPLPLRAVNRLGSLTQKTGLLPFTLERDRLLAQARKQAGSDDFGPEDFLEPLDRLLHSYRNDAQLNFIGLASAHVYLLRLLVNRLRLEQDRARYPAIADERIVAPVFILGLPRTGSTILFELLACDPRFRVPASWEVMFPSPPPGLGEQIEKRITTTDNMLQWVDRLSPEFKKIHPIGAVLPQECITIQAQAFRSVQFHTQNDVPGYQNWLDTADMQPAYRYHERFLQNLQYRSVATDTAVSGNRSEKQATAIGLPNRWLLKAPVHLFALDALFAVYPDASVIQTHRHPAAVIPSVSSFSATIRQSFSDHLDLPDIGATSCHLWTTALNRAMDFRATRVDLAHRFADLDYRDFIAGPVSTLPRLYDHIGMSFSGEDEQRATNYLDAHQQNRHGQHQYDLSQFGLTQAQLSSQFAHYIEHFALQSS